MEKCKTVFLIGSGGREHAMAWKISQSPQLGKLYAFPGNDGIAALEKAECLTGDVLSAANEIKPDLIIIGPEQPLAEGLTDQLEEKGFAVFGPSQYAAQLESSKVFSKNFMVKNDIPTAKHVDCSDYDAALNALENWNDTKGFVIKADALAAGKGVVVTDDREEARKTIHDFMVNPDCTVQTDKILIEEKLSGKEVSAFAVCDGKNFLTLGYACDYKRAFTGDLGPNTGGMGGYVPENWPSNAVKTFVEKNIFQKTLDGMVAEEHPFKGILFAGLMIDGDDVNVIEFNVRLGDPETQMLLPLIEDDLLTVFELASQEKLETFGKDTLKLYQGTAVHVVLASEGYPSTDGTPLTLGGAITMPSNYLNNSMNDNQPVVFLAGAKQDNQTWVNSGGRVLGVTALGETVETAREKAYNALKDISFHGAHWRDDIGQ